METVLQRNLKQKLEECGISATELERRTGLKHSAIQNIIYGRSKRPGIDIISAAAKGLGCSIEELLEDGKSNATAVGYHLNKNQSLSWNVTLYIEATREVHRLADKYKKDFNTEEVLIFIKEVYNYSLFHGKNSVDSKFAEWLINQNLNTK